MSNLPPPGSFGGPFPPQQPQPGFPQPGAPFPAPGVPVAPGYPTAPGGPGGPAGNPPWHSTIPQGLGVEPPKKSNSGKILAGIIAAVALIGVGVYFATKSDDKKSVTEATELTIDTTDAADTTDVPDTIVPETQATEAPTTEAAPNTTAAPDTTVAQTSPPITLTVPTVVATTVPTASTVAPPPNAVQLGNGVYIPLPDGWTDSVSGKVHTLEGADGSTDKVGVQIVTRTPGESPADPLNEYIGGFVNDSSAISFSPSFRLSVPSPTKAFEYGMYYTEYDDTADNGVGLIGGVYLFQRADGLTAIYDTYGTDKTMGVPNTEFNSFVSSFANAPQIDTPIDLQPADTFRLTTPTQTVTVGANIGFALAPGFTVVSSDGGAAKVTSGKLTFAVDYLPAQASIDAALQAAEANLGADNQNLVFNTVDTFDDYSGNKHQGVSWNGNAADGSPTTGTIDVYLDPDSTNGLAVIRSWAPTADGNEPDAIPEGFMYRSVEDELAAIGIP
ncbi:MAG: hypothetical protein JWL72_4663 [Ilumatobacteraceae bacterium]|nr:hypothetical protein [Ilumatobacteraceae bacterium]